jgi:chemotaxis protein CheZ
MRIDAANDPDTLQALFDSVAGQQAVTESAAPAIPAPESHPGGQPAPELPAERMLAGIGNLTRALHSSLRELGYDRAIEEAASTIPDARDRLAYVASMTEQAAQRALTATEIAKPIQDGLAAEAADLSAQWGRLLGRQMGLEGFRDLVERTHAYLENVPQRVSATNAQLLEIMMAQDFQDLTGQVIKKITDMIQFVEQQLLQLLVENLPPERRTKEANSLLNGPVIDPDGVANAVTTQKQVDDLLDSLGF